MFVLRFTKNYKLGAIAGGVVYLLLNFPCLFLSVALVVGEKEWHPWFLKFLDTGCFATYPFSWVLFVVSVFIGMGIHFLIAGKLLKKGRVNTKY